MTTEPIAIVGAACQYPDANTPAELWENVLAGRRAFRRLPDCRLRLDDYFSAVDDPSRPDTTYSAQAALITDYEFDRSRFRVVGSTFRSADMAHWLALDVAARAFADAGFPEGTGLPKEQVGVLVGNSLTGEFSRANIMRLRWPYVRRTVDAALAERGWSPEDRAVFLETLEAQYKAPFPPVGDETLAGGLSNTIAGRICNYFDLGGGGYTVDGACASSLLAVANACTALMMGDIDVALAGGVDLSLDPFELIGFAKVGALAKGEMRVYDARSAGFWPGEGCGMVVLMRASAAAAQHRRVYALIRGWGISSDGSGGITRPEVDGQKLALQRAYRRAGFNADSVGYFEGHGTGTAVGDATELEAVLAMRNGHSQCAAIGSIKANMGHTKAAAGIAGLLKATLALHHQMLPPSVGWEQPHPHLRGSDVSLRLLRRAEAWPADLPLRAAVSAMGFGGINTHVVLETAEAREETTTHPHIERLASSIQDAELFLFAAESLDQLQQFIKPIVAYASHLSFAELTDLAAELSRSLQSGAVRAAIVASRPVELQQALNLLLEWIETGTDQRLDIDRGVMLATSMGPPSIGYLFPGQGTAASLDGGVWAVRFPSIKQRYVAAGLPTTGDTVATEIAHPAIMTSCLSGLEILQRFGLNATIGIGHSLGELAAYHWAGAIDEATLMRVATARGRAIAEHGRTGGAMAGIATCAADVQRLIGDLPVVISGLNSPTQTIISGESAAVDTVLQKATAAGITAVRLPVSHAFHSPLVADAASVLAAALKSEKFQQPRAALSSTITGGVLDGDEDLRELLRRQMTSPVRLMDAVHAAEMKVDLWIEVGPGHVMRGIIGKLVAAPVAAIDAGGESLKDLMRAVGAAFVLGTPVKVDALFEDRFSRPFNLNWQPKFFVNPCELAPTTDTKLPSKPPEPLPEVEPLRALPSAMNRTPLEVVRQLVAERAELPLEAVREQDLLLQDLHFSSISVGGVVADAARALGLPPPVSPTDYARATVGEVAAALDELARTGIARSPMAESAPAGVDAWVRNFKVDLVEQPLPTARSAAPTMSGEWHVVAQPHYPFASHLQLALNERIGGRGVALYLPPNAAARHLADLLSATRLVLEQSNDTRFLVVQHGPISGGWARTLHLELPQVTTCVLNFGENDGPDIDQIIAEVNAADGYVEAHFERDRPRRVPMLRLIPSAAGEPLLLGSGEQRDAGPLTSDDVLLVTGGGKGIAAECALDLAKKYGVRLALLGRSQAAMNGGATSEIAPDLQLDENLARFTAAGVTFQYLSADVTDAAAVRAAVEKIQRTLGPVTAVLHGAGGNTPQSLRTIDEAAVRATLAPKITGLRNVLAAVDPDQLRLLVTFGSIIARTGLHGEADYALANEWLTADTEKWHREHPHCRCLAVEWSVWSGVGMGERLGRIEALRHQGITPITPDEGVRVMRRLIANPPEQVAVVVSGRFGDPPTLRVDRPELPLLRFLEQPRVYVPGVELVVDVTLSLGADPYLRDHAYQGTPLLPAVMGLEAMAQLSTALTGTAARPDFEKVELSRPVTVPENGKRAIRLAAIVRAPGKVEVVLRSEETGFQADHFRAMCRFERAQGSGFMVPEEGELARTTEARANGRLPLEPQRDLYGTILFHRGRFQRIEGYRQLSAKRCLADVSPDGAARWFGGFLPEKLLLGDAAMRDAAIHAIQACIPHGTILPIGIDRVTLGSAPLAGPCYVQAEEREHIGDRFVYDLKITSADGRVCEQWEGLHLQQVGQPPQDTRWAEPLLAPYLERRVAELIPGAGVSIAVAQKASDEAIAVVLHDTNDRVFRRPDGKPLAVCDRPVSLSHAGPLTISIASLLRTVACDCEPVVSRAQREWTDLLAPDRMALAPLIASNEKAIDAAATRLWTAGECIKKAGLSLDTPLILRESTSDNWVLLSAGSATIATWVGNLQDHSNSLAVAVLVGSDYE